MCLTLFEDVTLCCDRARLSLLWCPSGRDVMEGLRDTIVCSNSFDLVVDFKLQL